MTFAWCGNSAFFSVSLVHSMSLFAVFFEAFGLGVDKTCRSGSQLADIAMLSIGKLFFIHICAEV